ncbi:IS1595 family transposase [Sphingomonas sp. KR1UV-12]|uniref:IS1595 family transposase n=1 Tax=Sphingomonas aurea TaxID=3063994 RepID=A0ABT9EII0_9SPHN|nr:IS1595 family transposase [Sphingomonas sp. KR1UV-12]MDP1026772.1 IS1595 family transposase [Sphingomonas sp. KR1UV-12]
MDIGAMSEDAARAKFKAIRWEASNGDPVCPACGGLKHWTLGSGHKWKCKACRTPFSVTVGTVFESHKLSFRKLLGIVAVFANGVLGVSACRLSREVKISYKSAFVLLHRIREVMGKDDEAAPLSGVVEIDGAIFGGSLPRLPNKKELWEEFKAKNKAAARKKRKLIVVLRERQSEDPNVPAKVRTFLLPKEGDAIEIAKRMVVPDTIIHADRSTQWEPLHLHFDTKRIDHSKSFSDGIACTNQAESFFQRMRCAERGVHLHISGAHMPRYAWELGWREQYRRTPNGDQVDMILGLISRNKPSSTFRGYWRKRSENDNGSLASIAS